MLLGIDTASFQGYPDYDDLKGKIDFVITKVTEGNTYINPTWTYNRDHARRVGFLLGYYHFADITVPAVDQAKYFLKELGGDFKAGEILALDYEPVVAPANAVSFCKDFLDFVQSKTGVKPLLYLNQNLAGNNDWSPVIQGDYGLWLAQFDNKPENALHFQWPAAAIKQYSDTGKFDGIKDGTQNTDLDSFFGDRTAFKKFGFSADDFPATNRRRGRRRPASIHINQTDQDLAFGFKDFWLTLQKAGDDLNLRTLGFPVTAEFKMNFGRTRGEKTVQLFERGGLMFELGVNPPWDIHELPVSQLIAAYKFAQSKGFLPL